MKTWLLLNSKIIWTVRLQGCENKENYWFRNMMGKKLHLGIPSQNTTSASNTFVGTFMFYFETPVMAWCL